MTKKFCKEWGLPERGEYRSRIQLSLDGGERITREGKHVTIGVFYNGTRMSDSRIFGTSGEAVKFAAALNRLRRPLRLIKKDLDADWAARVKGRDGQTCAICGVTGDIRGRVIPAHDEVDDETGKIVHVKERTMKDVLTAHHWLKTKARAGMARWARPCGVTVHFAEHIHLLHENPCWADLKPIHDRVVATEGPEQLSAAMALTGVAPTEARVRALWLERCGKKVSE